MQEVFDRVKRDFHNVKGPSRTDRRYVYSAGCTFHGPIYDIGTKTPRDGSNHRLPCCPSCGSMLFEMETQEQWDRQIQEFAKKEDPAYPAFMAWFGALRPCRPVRNQADFDARRAEFDALPKT
jgi:hypothetical protein